MGTGRELYPPPSTGWEGPSRPGAHTAPGTEWAPRGVLGMPKAAPNPGAIWPRTVLRGGPLGPPQHAKGGVCLSYAPQMGLLPGRPIFLTSGPVPGPGGGFSRVKQPGI